ncbi:GatB/YqeY domain-containing protein [Dichelobacter nodosus]|uniref:GatB-Yqey domain protein n=1 Tax=Dichelobacter nodosus (strain VCS1703A) TaxID=246195 RepID=A5EXR6_DICNV|nr:GatB/YqeY domain-containing protein [Dichelobacter nodosus]ABQ14233.1 GatB-Yqey domain protein [Dichelobacter nodosus VCS1703A]AXM45859.1 glutamyl-tRNA amidotransferase [Dichelobacter nodosus]KNZ39025.1 glutamyl-tRNA amidotransferase [Dichelobacter nodosus]TGA64687.1 glutamyl-tRNA amidotransferase [Dichelobacter nodosus]
MLIQEQLKSAIKEAMLAKDKAVLQTLRMMSAAFKQIEIDQKIEITDEVAINELVRQIKQRQDAMQQYRQADREDLAQQEEAEIAIIQRFLPAQLSVEEMQAHVDKVIADSQMPLAISSMGALMGILKKDLQGKADMAAVSAYLRQKLQAS